VAYAASHLGVKSTIVMPKSTPIAKIQATEGYGAKVILHGDCYDDSCAYAKALAEESGDTFIHPFDDLDVIAGQGTVGLEILQDLHSVDTVLVPAGGGGLLSGVAFYLKTVNPRIRVVGVQAEGAAAIVRSCHAHNPICLDPGRTIADGIAVKEPGALTLDLIQPLCGRHGERVGRTRSPRRSCSCWSARSRSWSRRAPPPSPRRPAGGWTSVTRRWSACSPAATST
jgi:threonine dehydratase